MSDLDFHILGNGDPDKGRIMVNQLASRVAHARAKHPVYAASSMQAERVIRDELDEFKEAIAEEPWDRQLDELMDVMATCVRFYNEEWKR